MYYTAELYANDLVIRKEMINNFPSKCLSDLIIPSHILRYTQIQLIIKDCDGKEINTECIYNGECFY